MSITVENLNNKQDFINYVIEKSQKNEEIKSQSLRKEIGEKQYHKLLKIFNSVQNLLIEAGLKEAKPNYEYTDEELRKKLHEVYNKYGKINKKLFKEETKIKERRYDKFCSKKTFWEILEEEGLPFSECSRKNISKETASKEIYRIEKEIGYVSRPIIDKYSKMNSKVVNRIWGTFDNMYKDLQVKRHPSGIVATDQELLDNMKILYNKFGFVNTMIIENESKYLAAAYERHFGGIENARKILGIINPKMGGSCDSRYVIMKFSKYLDDNAEIEKTFPWLIAPDTKCKLRIDAYFPKYNIGLEYNGPQHYKIENCYTSDLKDFERRQYLDKLKIQLCHENGIEIITVSYLDKINEDYIRNSINKILSATRTA